MDSSATPPDKGLSFAETATLARRRGAQFARGIAAERPNAIILTLFLNSVLSRAGQADNPDDLLAREHYGLLPASLNGMLDAAPPELILVDGCGSTRLVPSHVSAKTSKGIPVMARGPIRRT